MSRVLQASLLVLCVMLMTCRGQNNPPSNCADVERCMSCPEDPEFCNTCRDPYTAVDGKCVETTTTTTTSTTTTTTTTEAPADDDCNYGVMCARCSRSYGCMMCKTGSFQTSRNGKFVCDMCGQNCAACTSAAQCTTCVRGAAMKKGRSCLFYINESRQLTTATALAAVAVLLLSLTL